MKRISIIWVTVLFTAINPRIIDAHPGHTNAALMELNDYLMAIQVMRVYDDRASGLFKEWQTLREASWKIRELTDEENLKINTSKVMDQIALTKRLQQSLLMACRTYFSQVMDEEQGIRFELGSNFEVNWNGPKPEVPINQSRVVLIEVLNSSNKKYRLEMRSSESDELLFWNKIFDLNPGERRYSFLIIAPLKEGPMRSTISISDKESNTTSLDVLSTGVASDGTIYTLKPGRDIYRVELPEGVSKVVDQLHSSGPHINFHISDAITNEPISARIEVIDSNDQFHWSPLEGASYGVNRDSYGWSSTLWKFQPGPYFYIDGSASLRVPPSGKKVNIYRGFEYKSQSFNVPENGKIEVGLERWIDMPSLGWYSGHTHIHTTDAGMPVQFSENWPMVSRAEDLHISSILTLKGEWETHAIYANEYPMGERKTFSTPEHRIVYGQEYRNNPYGHIALLGLDYLIQPISSGAVGELGGPDYPPNSTILDEAINQDAVTIGAHFGNFITEGKQIKTPWPSTGFEMPTDVALGKMHLAEIYGEGGQQKVWYDLLNCGFQLPATAGPDWAIKDTPRVYVKVEGEFTFDNWLEGLRRGQSFITTGPMLFFSVDDFLPGTFFEKEGRKAVFKVQANALTPDSSIPAEIVFNGNVIASGTDLNEEIQINDSGWLAARCEGAHSNPVYINFDGRPPGFATPAMQFVEITNRLIDWVNKKGLYDTQEQRDEVLETLVSGRETFSKIAKKAIELGRQDP